jgi:hypothetical protein
MPEDWVCPECAALGIDAFIASFSYPCGTIGFNLWRIKYRS